MKPQQAAPIVATLAPAVLAAPPILFAAAIGLGLIWLLSGEDDKKPAPKETPPPAPTHSPEPDPIDSQQTQQPAPAKKIMREDLAEALAYGEKPITRKEAVEKLQALGFRKTAAYKALSPSGKFGSLLEFTPDGLIEWKG